MNIQNKQNLFCSIEFVAQMNCLFHNKHSLPRHSALCFLFEFSLGFSVCGGKHLLVHSPVGWERGLLVFEEIDI